MTMIPWLLSVALATVLVGPAQEDGKARRPAGEGPVKVFILAGQSNMEGAGAIRADLERNGGMGSLEFLVKDPATAGHYGHLIDDQGEWLVRDDVWIWYLDRKGGLTAGYGAREDRIGPELQFGHVVGDAFEEPVLLIKVAWGGKSLAQDFRPPSRGGEVGPCYTQLFQHVRDVLGNLEAHFPDYGGQGYEIVGFGWHQGWNDRVNQAFNDAYETNLAHFIRDVRQELAIDGLPFVIAETGMSGHEEKHPRALSLMRAQAAVAQAEEFQGNVAFVGTRDFYRPAEVSPSGQAYHWNSNAETYLLIGQGMGEAMLELVGAAPPPPAAADDLESHLEWWRDARFGLFIHWGLYSIPAGEWQGETNHAEWILTTAQIPVAEYDQFVPEFNPVEFDADEWARLARAAGMRYVVITTKHHDGFCLFDSKHTDHDVMSTPFRRDIMKELAEACRRHGLGIGWYHSIMDWHHPDYLPRRGWESRPATGADFERYVRHLHAQVEELLSRYGDIDVMWFDGEWEATWTHQHGLDLYRHCRELSPEVLINNRVDKGRGGMAGLTIDDKYVGDFGTPEQEIPATGLPGVDWETCMTMNRHWGWNVNDHAWKSVDELLQKLVDIASKGGNFLLNVGPTPDGRFPQEAIERLRGMGEWMDRHGESIYGTRASPFASLPWGRCTMKEDGERTTLYLHVFEWPEDGRLVVPGLGNALVSAKELGRGRSLDFHRAGGSIEIALPDRIPGPGPFVVALQIEGAPIVFGPPGIHAAADVLIDELEVVITKPSRGLAVHYTLDGSVPTTASSRCEGPILLTGSAVVSARSFHDGEPVSDTVVREFLVVEPVPAVAAAVSSPGLVAEVFSGDWEVLPDFDQLQPESRTVLARVQPLDPQREHHGLRLRGFLEVEADGLYLLAIDSDDGSRVLVDDRLVVDNDGLHGPELRSGVVALAAGKHALTVEWFNRTGGAELELRIAPVGAKLLPVSPEALSHPNP